MVSKTQKKRRQDFWNLFLKTKMRNKSLYLQLFNERSFIFTQNVLWLYEDRFNLIQLQKRRLYWFGIYTARSIPASKSTSQTDRKKQQGWEYKLLKLRDNYQIYYKYIIFIKILFEFLHKIKKYIYYFLMSGANYQKRNSLAVILYIGFGNLVLKLVKVNVVHFCKFFAQI